MFQQRSKPHFCPRTCGRRHCRHWFYQCVSIAISIDHGSANRAAAPPERTPAIASFNIREEIKNNAIAVISIRVFTKFMKERPIFQQKRILDLSVTFL